MVFGFVLLLLMLAFRFFLVCVSFLFQLILQVNSCDLFSFSITDERIDLYIYSCEVHFMICFFRYQRSWLGSSRVVHLEEGSKIMALPASISHLAHLEQKLWLQDTGKSFWCPKGTTLSIQGLKRELVNLLEDVILVRQINIYYLCLR